MDRSGDTIGWLEEKGIEFDCIPYFHLPDQKALTWHVPEGGGAQLIRVLKSKCEALGAELLRRTPARRIIISDRGQGRRNRPSRREWSWLLRHIPGRRVVRMAYDLKRTSW